MSSLFDVRKLSKGELVAHEELVRRAGVWLRRTLKCSAVLLEPGYGSPGEIPDAIGWRAGRSVLVECKASRGDFLRDGNKPSRRNDGGMGMERWYFAPAGLLDADEIPDGWGLAEVRGHRGGGRVYRVVNPPRASRRSEAGMRRELALLSGFVANCQFAANEWFPPDSVHADHNFGRRPA